MVLVVVASLLSTVPLAVSAAQEQEPNDSREGAQAISAGETISGDVTSFEDDDWFSFTAGSGSTTATGRST